MLAVMRDLEKICRFVLLPVQSGSSGVLRRMKRLYTRERYLEIIGRIRAEIPDMLFSTDVIVGFPGETDEDFEQTLSLLREVRFGGIFAFKYSPRPGTPALRLRDHVDDAVASERLQRIFELQEQIEAETLASYVGRRIAVLYEGPSRHDPSVLSGKSDEKLTVNFKSPTELRIGSIVPVRIEQALHHTLRGEAIV
jgi:tRNA-2-methylthio-N6-dimethylallyladenosine synthase